MSPRKKFGLRHMNEVKAYLAAFVVPPCVIPGSTCAEKLTCTYSLPRKISRQWRSQTSHFLSSNRPTSVSSTQFNRKIRTANLCQIWWHLLPYEIIGKTNWRLGKSRLLRAHQPINCSFSLDPVIFGIFRKCPGVWTSTKQSGEGGSRRNSVGIFRVGRNLDARVCVRLQSNIIFQYHLQGCDRSCKSLFFLKGLSINTNRAFSSYWRGKWSA